MLTRHPKLDSRGLLMMLRLRRIQTDGSINRSSVQLQEKRGVKLNGKLDARRKEKSSGKGKPDVDTATAGKGKNRNRIGLIRAAK
eukprot:845036-Karenia_brevis.AAC.1